MCTAPRVSNTAAQQQAAEADAARQREEERQARITAGRKKIDDAYAGFDDGYFQTYRQTALDNTLPQVQQQAADARRNLIYALERAGTRNSSIAGQRSGDLERDIALRTGEAISSADSATQQLRNRVTDSRASSEAQLLATEDPTRAANDATARSATLRADAPPVSTLGPLFEGAALGYSAYQQGKRQVAADASAARLLANLETASRTGR